MNIDHHEKKTSNPLTEFSSHFDSERFRYGLYDESFEKDGCGTALVARPDGIAKREVVEQALQILANLEHRGAVGGDGRTSDGAGILIQIPKSFFFASPDLRDALESKEFGVGMIFFSRDQKLRRSQEIVFEEEARAHGFKVLAWRTVPTENYVLGEQARSIEPVIRQVFLESSAVDPAERDAALLRLRKRAENRLRSNSGARDPRTGRAFARFYVASLSFETLVYKGLIGPGELAAYFPDLQRSMFESAFALVHSRFSTNTLPEWELAHPYRFICHNGEINTLRGNLNWMKAREAFAPEQAPFIPSGLSDSASLDHAVELMLRNGRAIDEALMILVPQAWENDASLAAEVQAFYRFHAPRMEPWDGPAAICFTDGRKVGAMLDRNGLRPCRYLILDDGSLVLSSEVGALRAPASRISRRGRLGPGQMIVVDPDSNSILFDEDIKSRVAKRADYSRAVLSEQRALEAGSPMPVEPSDWKMKLALFGYSEEEIRMVLEPLFKTGEETTSSMGNDTPLAILSERPQPLFRYFRQLFAQVTNPPIDPIREKLVMSLTGYLGSKPSPFHTALDGRRRLRIPRPILTGAEFRALSASTGKAKGGMSLRRLGLGFPLSEGETGFERSLRELCREAVEAVNDGVEILILSDREASPETVPLPSLLATAAVHHALIRAGLRTRVSIVIETGEARDVHHFACLIGYGAEAVHPFLAFELAEGLKREGRWPDGVDVATLSERFVEGIGKGLLTILSKMGISTLRSYCGAQLFEAIGLSSTVIDEFFTGTVSRLGGLDILGIASETLLRHRSGLKEFRASLGAAIGLPAAGEIHFRSQGETHFWNPSSVSKLQIASRSNSFATYREFSKEAQELGRGTLRGLLKMMSAGPRVPLDEVESEASLVRRFTTGAMSFGSLSQEAHETLAIAMNRIGGKSNSGEGGEDADRFLPLANGDSKNSAIKQVASGRFGVTSHYLVHARELQIKIAQGAKPGEGGKLPGHKVDRTIARLRHSTPGVTLISPPPHHDIYSIEDLAQLIHDLRRANFEAAISVKLVAEAGVGTIAAGVAKAGADKILISGDNGGTGASALSSIKSAGGPWELGLSEAHQTLVMQGLRGRVRLEADGQMKTGRDVAIAALLGADEYGFSTAPLIVEGCVIMRKCHLNTCPVGVATQDPELRKKFRGEPEYVINFFFFVARELRELMSELGFRTLQEMIGRADCLKTDSEDRSPKASTLDLSPLLVPVTSLIPGVPTLTRHTPSSKPREIEDDFEVDLLDACSESLRTGKKTVTARAISNSNRSVGTSISSHVSRIFGAKGLPDDTIVLNMKGTAGQSFGAFLAKGVTLRLEGDANDSVGKGLSGGKIVIGPEPASGFRGGVFEDVVAGNACLYGATSGTVFISGNVGERFAVRNSGVFAVVEGVGDHCCEYMTGGLVVVLGGTGRNFAAGMSGGIAYVFDGDGRFRERCNSESVEIASIDDPDAEVELRRWIERHGLETGSRRARRLLSDWPSSVAKFVSVIPMEYKSALNNAKIRSDSSKRTEQGEIAHG